MLASGVPFSASVADAETEFDFATATEMEVLVDNGEPGANASSAVDPTDSVSVVDVDVCSDCTEGVSASMDGLREVSSGSSGRRAGGLLRVAVFGECTGDRYATAAATICAGGFDFGEKVKPNASAGSSGREVDMIHS